MNNTLLKDTFRSVARNKLRFISVVVIVALGVSFYVGIKSASPQMNSTANRYFTESNLADVRVTSRIPFSDDDIKIISEFDGVDRVVKARYVDALISVRNNQIVDSGGMALSCRVDEFDADAARRYSESGEADSDYFNRLTLVDGRYPESEDECVIDERAVRLYEELEIGETVKLNGDGASVTNLLDYDELKIVGTVNSPLYVSTERGSSQVGSGSLSAFIYADSKSFSAKDYNELFIKIKDSESYDKFSNPYDTYVSQLAEKIQSVSAEAIDSKISDIKADYNGRIADKEKEISDYEALSETQLSDKKKEIDEFKAYVKDEDKVLEKEKAESESAKSSAKNSLESISKQFTELQKAYDGNVSSYDGSSHKIDGYAELKKLYDDLNKTHKEDKKSLDSLKNKMDASLASVEKVRADVSDAENEVKSCESKIASLESDTATLKSEISALEGEKKTQESRISSLEAEIEDLRTKIYELEVKGNSEDGLSASDQLNMRTYRTNLSLRQSELSSAKRELDDITSRMSAKESSLSSKSTELTGVRNNLPSFRSVLTNIQSELSVAQTEYNGAKSSYETAKQSYDKDSATLNKYKSSMDELTSGQTELVNLQKTIEEQKKSLDNLKVSLTVAQIRYSLAVRNGDMKVQKAQSELNEAKVRYATIDSEYTDLKAETEQKKANLEGDLKTLRNTLKNIESIRWSATAQTNLTGHRSFITSMENINQMSTIFPLIFLFTAMVASFVIMLKNVEDERNSIGLFKAFGYSSVTITSKYILYSTLAWVFGSVIGVIVGSCIFPNAIYSIYGSAYTIPNINIAFNARYIFRGMAASFITTNAASCIAAFRELRHHPAELLRPKMISYNRRSLIERIPELWIRMSYGTVILVRAISRSRKRVIVGTLAIACCTALILSAFGLLNSTSDVKAAQYSKNGVFRYDVQLVLNAEQTPDDSVTSEKLDKDKNVESSMLISNIAYDVSATTSRWNGFDTAHVIVPENTDELGKYVSLKAVSGKIDFSGAVISEKLAKDLGLSVGSDIYFTDSDSNVHSSVVAGIVKNYIDHYVYFSPEVYESVFNEQPQYKYIFCDVKDYLTEAELSNFNSKYLKTDEIVGARTSSVLADSVDISIDQVLSLVILFVLSACLLASIVMYTISNVNISERTHEIANIKVMGFSDGEVLVYIIRENIVSTAVGLVMGLIGGIFLHRALVGYISVANVMYGTHIMWWSFIVSALLILAVALAAAVPILLKVSRINIPETLKVIE